MLTKPKFKIGDIVKDKRFHDAKFEIMDIRRPLGSWEYLLGLQNLWSKEENLTIIKKREINAKNKL